MKIFHSRTVAWGALLSGVLVWGCAGLKKDSRQYFKIQVDSGFIDRMETHLLKINQEEWDREYSCQPVLPPDDSDPFANRRPEFLAVKNHRDLLELAGVPFPKGKTVLFLPDEGKDGLLLIAGDDDYFGEVMKALTPYLSRSALPGKD